jgi:acyl transferase domain-containing protein
VAVASHTPLMNEAAAEFARALAEVPMDRPHSVLFSHAAERVHDDVEARQALAAQIANTVRWDECMEGIRSRGPSCILEVGPAKRSRGCGTSDIPRFLRDRAMSFAVPAPSSVGLLNTTSGNNCSFATARY